MRKPRGHEALAVGVSLGAHALACALMLGHLTGPPLPRGGPPAMRVALVAAPRVGAKPPAQAPSRAARRETITLPAAPPETPAPPVAAADPQTSPTHFTPPEAPAQPPQRSQAPAADPLAVYKAEVWRRIAARRPRALTTTSPARVDFQLDDRGALVSLGLDGSSGSPAFDRASLDAVRSAAPFPTPPAGTALEALRFLITIRPPAAPR